ncbi:glycoside hydrolase family 3 C-terminal domain-containing protein [Alistipes timonensis]|uniref:glycoside hydrolase family 3 C-terminal domain-containing protein n=1 Tax=Alistipes timonensis TaxID=1465754 RepID=UPI0020CC3CC4|nr:glycoside hydrolase family 3 C-terminal domain-containing protein [Alistipes timonensis]MCR2031917.1 glycoside hydrolase family 3 C-terminal domain-containing protein [Alistipes timonensis]
MKYFFIATAILFCTLLSAICGDRQPQNDVAVYLDESQPLEKRVEDALSRMTLEEKVAILHAQSKFSSAGVPRLGIPEVWCTDGPHGIRPEVLWDEWEQAGWTNDSCTSFPALTCLAATWNPEMSALYGKSIGEEARYREKDILLGPGVNIYRTPLNGRNFEYMGEDPFLSARMVVPYIREVQKNGVAACVKHFALNNQEQNRLYHDVVVDDRALHEIYLPAFKAAVEEGGAWAIMGAYNKYKGQHCCHNQYLLNDILKRDWAFAGVVVSDWGGAHDTKQAAGNGLDLEFGSWTNGVDWSLDISNVYDNYFLAGPYLEMLRQGKASVKQLDDKARRVLRLIFRTAMNTRKPFGSLNSPEHLAAARRIAGEGMVLLKNDGGVLPIDLAKAKTIAVMGENAIKMMTVGGGSSSLKVRHEYTPLEGIRAAADGKAEVIYERGYVGDVTGDYNGVKTGQDLSEKRSEAQLIADAVAAARKADAVIFVGGLNKSRHQDSEQVDRLEYGLPYSQDKVIKALADTNPNLAVVIVSGNAVAMPWIDRVPAVLEAWFSGSEAGNALADVVFGAVNPSGKLPFTFPVRLEDNSAHALGEYPGTDKVTYNEGIFVGYRWHDKEQLKPLFAFGHGLSYTTFDITNVQADRTTLAANGRIRVSADVTNTGSRPGAEVVQLYIGDEESSLPRPVKELKGFQKIALDPGQTQTVTFEITPDMLQYYDDAKGAWVAEPGTFTAYVGAASDDIHGIARFELK